MFNLKNRLFIYGIQGKEIWLYLIFVIFSFSFVLYEISLETNLEYSGKLRLA